MTNRVHARGLVPFATNGIANATGGSDCLREDATLHGMKNINVFSGGMSVFLTLSACSASTTNGDASTTDVAATGSDVRSDVITNDAVIADSSTTADVLNGDSMDAASDWKHGVIVITQATHASTGAPTLYTSESVSFVDVALGSDTSVTDVMPGQCRVIQVTSPPGTRDDVSAGTVRFIADDGTTIAASPSSDSTYVTPTQSSLLWSSGSTVMLSATGSVVPAFQTSITFPPTIIVTSPVASVTDGTLLIPRTTPLSLRWNGAATGTAALLVFQSTSTGSTEILCTYPISDGADMIAPSVLQYLSAGTASVVIGSITLSTIGAGDYVINIDAIASDVIATATIQ